jgi:hypothetical protein
MAHAYPPLKRRAIFNRPLRGLMFREDDFRFFLQRLACLRLTGAMPMVGFI